MSKQKDRIIVIAFANYSKIFEQKKSGEFSFFSCITSKYFNFSKTVYSHVELCFIKPSLNVTDMESYSAYSHTTPAVVVQDRSFSNDCYEYIFLKVNEKQRRECRKFLHDQLGKNFDFKGSIRSPFFSRTDVDYESWYCCSLITEALISCGLLGGIRSNSIEIDDLYDILNNHSKKTIFQTPRQISQKVQQIQQTQQQIKKQTRL